MLLQLLILHWNCVDKYIIYTNYVALCVHAGIYIVNKKVLQSPSNYKGNNNFIYYAIVYLFITHYEINW